MCDICKAAVDPNNDYEGDLLFAPLKLNDYDFGLIQVGIQSGILDDKEPKPVLFMAMEMNCGPIIYKNIKINYCPMCGQKLTD